MRALGRWKRPGAFRFAKHEVVINAVLPIASGRIAYRKLSSTARSLVRSFDMLDWLTCFELTFSALFHSTVQKFSLYGLVMRDPMLVLISQYAPTISVVKFYCRHLHAPTESAVDRALFYDAFNKFACIQKIECTNLPTELLDQLRQLCLNKQITFTE